jgi:hypothetical protein
MVERKVSHIIKDKDDVILALGNPSSKWSPRLAYRIIQDIEGKKISYYIEGKKGQRNYFYIVGNSSGKNLKINLTDSSEINLTHLSDRLY